MKINYGLIFKELVEKEGYKLLSEYINTRNKVEIRCNKKHIYNVIPSKFKSGNRCPKCAGLCSIQAKERFIELLEGEGYKLIGEYINTSQKVDVICSDNHTWNIKPNNFSNGARCPYCYGKNPIQAKEQFLLLLEKEGYKLLSEYINTSQKVEIICNKGHIYEVSPHEFKSGSRCPKCVGTCPIQAKEQFIQVLDQEGYKLLSEYINTRTKVLLKCPEGHEWNVKPNCFKHHYHRCPHCKGSTGQRKLQSMLEQRGLVGIYNDRKVLNGLELDIYYPDLKIAIEYQGNYWHSFPDQIKRDKKKKKMCKKLNIKLLEVWDNDFMDKPIIIESQLYSTIIGKV